MRARSVLLTHTRKACVRKACLSELCALVHIPRPAYACARRDALASSLVSRRRLGGGGILHRQSLLQWAAHGAFGLEGVASPATCWCSIVSWVRPRDERYFPRRRQKLVAARARGRGAPL